MGYHAGKELIEVDVVFSAEYDGLFAACTYQSLCPFESICRGFRENIQFNEACQLYGVEEMHTEAALNVWDILENFRNTE